MNEKINEWGKVKSTRKEMICNDNEQYNNNEKK